MKPILFNTEDVRAILDGRKIVTRRVVKPQPIWSASECGVKWRWKGDKIWWRNYDDPMDVIPEKYFIFKPGDILYVREIFGRYPSGEYCYKADFIGANGWKGWSSPVQMPKAAARLFLRVTNVRVERLQDISDKDILREGTPDSGSPEANKGYFADDLWDSTIKKVDLPSYGWGANPYVWRVSFERISKEEVYKCTLNRTQRNQN